MKTSATMTPKQKGLKQPQTVDQTVSKKQYHWPFDLHEHVFKKSLHFFGIIMIALVFSNSIQAQNNMTVKGTITDDNGPVDQVTITLKGTETRTISDKKGLFTFPQVLKENDVLVFSHVGYQTQEIKIDRDTPFIEVALASENIQILGALQSDKPYKSKRQK